MDMYVSQNEFKFVCEHVCCAWLPLQVREKDLSLGQCWARCDAPSTWEVRWEGSANVDDGTAQVCGGHPLPPHSRYNSHRSPPPSSGFAGLAYGMVAMTGARFSFWLFLAQTPIMNALSTSIHT